MGKPCRLRIKLGGAVSPPLRGGIGACWHAIARGPRDGSAGSAWGGNPPAADAARWRELYKHADWLGFDFMRVELEQRSYLPERGLFTWESEDMLALRRILDWCQARGVRVFLQQMFCNVEWNRYPGVDALHSAPRDFEAWAEGLAALARKVVREWGYSCVRWLCVSNEPECDFSWWQGDGGQPLSILPGLQAARSALDRAGLQELPLAGPDYTGLNWPVEKAAACLPWVGALDLHSYLDDFRLMPPGHSAPEKNLAMWVAAARAAGKPLFLTELGCMRYGWYEDSPAPGGYMASLGTLEVILRGLRAGVEGFCRWSFVNRGDLDGQWQLVDTWDVAADNLRPRFQPHPNAYWLFGLLSRFFPRPARPLLVQDEEAVIKGWQQYILPAALAGADGHFSLFVLALTEQSHRCAFEIEGLDKPVMLSRYRLTETIRDQTEGVRLDSSERLELSPRRARWEDHLPGLSFTVYSTLWRPHEEPVHGSDPSFVAANTGGPG